MPVRIPPPALIYACQVEFIGIVHILPIGAEVNIMIVHIETSSPGKEHIGVYIYGLIRRVGLRGKKAQNSKLPDIISRVKWESIAPDVGFIDTPVVSRAS
ncbi:MAG: hypothetical protein ACYSYL_21730, partial [Planctomycetota bacterium]